MIQKLISSLKNYGSVLIGLILSAGWIVAAFQYLQKQKLLAKLFKSQLTSIHAEAKDVTEKKLGGMSDNDVIDFAIAKGAEKSKSKTDE